MKRLNQIVWPITSGPLLVSLTLGLAFSSLAQTNPLPPVVTIVATDPVASWAGDTGTFTVFRRGDPTLALNVYCRIFGTATNGVDYQMLGNFISIPSGATSNTVTVTPINNGQTTTKTVTLVLTPSPLVPPVNYVIGNPSNATVFILPRNVTNLPPFVDVVYPHDGAVFYGPTNISLLARASDLDGFVTNVEFFAGAMDLGRGLPVVLDPPGIGGIVGPVFWLSWSNVAPGAYPLTAVATDNGGASTTSTIVNITVLPGPPPTNLPPIVRITSPPNGAVFRAPMDIPLFAYAADRDGFVTSVEFFAGGNSLGLAHHLSTVPGPWPTPNPTNLWTLIWSNPPPATNIALTAVATDNGGASRVSPAVHISILPSPPPPTNRPPLVSIVATDPIAIEGTNCWPWLGLGTTAPTWSNWFGPTPIWRFFTNCGPKNATFTLHRFGATNDDLFVSYNIGGTATNGVDYVTLPGFATIPAGERQAAITVVPLDDGPPDINSTVVLRLTPGTNYLVGFPPAAAAIILDSRSPHPVTGMVPGSGFNLAASGPDGAWFHIEFSTDLLNWTPLVTNQVVNGTIDFVDPDSQNSPSRFYRAVPEAGPPAQ